ncbi:MAG: hypothetical protein JW940_08895, partial [Polyangiaceae bacterium]|nr:hypothetical protein [Polyangiaceae bacterium]
SHDTGLAVDLYVFNTQGKRRAGRTNVTLVGGREYDKERTKQLALLIKEVVASGFPVQEAWFNDTDINAAVGSVPGSSAPLLRTDDFRCNRKPAGERATCNRHMHHDHIHVLLRGTHPHSAEHVAALLGLVWSWD